MLTGLMMSVSSMANDAEPATSSQHNDAENSVSSTTSDVDTQEIKKSLKNPNSLLVAMAFKFGKNTEGSPNDYAEVIASYCHAAKSGDANAQYALGWMYANGRGVPMDKGIAALLFAKAAEQKHALALESLAKISDTTSHPKLPSCLLHDSPTVASTAAIDMAQNEQKTVSDETTARIYSQNHIFKLVGKLAPLYKIDVNLAMAFIAVESGFNVQATSPKNAQGLMQLIPATAKRFGVKNTYKAEDNIKGGLAYLQWLLAYFKGNVQLVAAAYNAGESAVVKYKGVPPYAETRMYVKKITKLYNKSSHPYRDDLVKASPFLNLPDKKAI
ncbi:MAG: transglycosylase SLT domain-containing protein [Methylotenera sp.]